MNILKNSRVTAHTGTKKDGSYRVVTGTFTGFGSRDINRTHYVVLVEFVDDEGVGYAEPIGRIIWVEAPIATTAPVAAEPVAAPVAAEPTFTVAMPVAFAHFVEGTNMMTGADDFDPLSKAARLAFKNARQVRRGRGYTFMVTADRATLDVFTDYANTVLTCGGFERDEIKAAAAWVKRVPKP